MKTYIVCLFETEFTVLSRDLFTSVYCVVNTYLQLFDFVSPSPGLKSSITADDGEPPVLVCDPQLKKSAPDPPIKVSVPVPA